jgi:hypothetical protein
MTPDDCSAFEALAPELALGVLSGDERATALAHLARCPACQATLDDLARVADHLLLLTPITQPPIGFESRVMARLSAETAQATPSRWRRSWSRRVIATVAAAVVVVVLGVVAGLAATRSSSHPVPAEAIRTAEVWADGGSCRVIAFPAALSDGRTELIIRLDEPGEGNGSYPVLVQPAGKGSPVLIGTISLHGGRGMMDTAIPAGLGKVRGIQVNEANGDVKYRAAFSPI